MMSNVQLPGSNYAAFGTGTHADYRFADNLAASVDLTASLFGGDATSETVEVGSRFRPLPFSADISPFIDLRGGYTLSHDTYFIPGTSTPIPGGPGLQHTEGSRYSRGIGAIAGGGVDFSLTESWGLSTGLTALRARMTAYRLTGTADVPRDNTYWMTSFRFTVGLKYNASRSENLRQKPSSSIKQNPLR